MAPRRCYLAHVSLASFKDLCIDAVDVQSVAAFWAKALGLDLEALSNGGARLSGPTPSHTVWINHVPEAKSVHHRLHIDVHTASVDELVELGATIVDGDSFRWTIMNDPDGGEFCAFVREDYHDYRLYEVVMQCLDHASQSAWWQSTIGGDRVIDERGFSYLEDIPNMPFEALSFVPVTEPKVVKNRVHLDLTTSGDLNDTSAQLVATGAQLLRQSDDEIAWDVLADPEGNEFCLFS